QTTTSTRTSSFCYDMVIANTNCPIPNHSWPNTGILNQETIEPGAMSGGSDPTLWQQTTYTLDANGNRTSVSVTGYDNVASQPGIVTRQTTFVYDQNHQFITEKHTSPSQGVTFVEKYSSSAAFGKPLTYSDVNNLPASWQYDTFGRKTLEARPDGTQTAFSYNSCSGGNCPCQPGSSYYVRIQPLSASGAANGPMQTIHYDS